MSNLASNFMKTLVIYYSLTDNCRFMAKTLAEELSTEILEIKPIKDIKKTGMMRIFWGGRQVMAKTEPELEAYEFNPENYDRIFMGTPVWVTTYTPAWRTFLKQNADKIKNKKLAFFTAFGGNAGKTYQEYQKALPDNEYMGEFGLKEPLQNPEQSKKEIKKWAERFK